MRHLSLILTLSVLPSLALAAECPSDAPEGYSWLPGYVTEYKEQGTISSWFTGSLEQHPEDFALLALKALFDSEGDVDAARALYVERGGDAQRFDVAMACAAVDS